MNREDKLTEAVNTIQAIAADELIWLNIGGYMSLSMNILRDDADEGLDQ